MTKLNMKCINTIRMLSADAVQKANSGHPGMPMGDADMAFVLWTTFLNHNPKNPFWMNRDRFILSAGHGSMLLYSLLHLTGYDISLDDIKQFRQLESKTPGHPEYCLETGVELSTGPLGFGFGVGTGMAMAEKYLADYFNRPGFNLVDYYIYAIVSDGDVMEGVSSESASLAGHLRLGKLIYLYSDNKTTIDGHTNLTFTEDVGKRFEAFNWHVQHVDGYDLSAIERAIAKAKDTRDKPSLIVARTHLGYGSPNKQDIPDIHGAPLGAEELRLTKENFGWPQKEFYIPAEVLKCYHKAIPEGEKKEKAWNDLFERYKKKYPDLATSWENALAGNHGDKWKESLPVYDLLSGSVATRSALGNVLNSIADDLPFLVGGSADLSPSNLTYLKKYPPFSPGKSGRNVHYGVREFAMGTAVVGMALSKMLIPYGGTYLVFANYMMASIRMAALMKANAIFVLTHDSIGVGEDGPSHHPVEQLTTLRAIPDLVVIRPADANETIAAWEFTLNHRQGPVALSLTRQSVPVIDRTKYASQEGLKHGAYILADSGKPCDLILLATGSEVHLALEAYEELIKEGVAARVVSLPSFEIFEQQSDEYKESILPSSVDKRISIEAGATLCWYKYVGLKGKVIGIDRFGLSAPSPVLFKAFGFTLENVMKNAHELLKNP